MSKRAKTSCRTFRVNYIQNSPWCNIDSHPCLSSDLLSQFFVVLMRYLNNKLTGINVLINKRSQIMNREARQNKYHIQNNSKS